MYLISAVFVHLFGKYITPFEKIVVAEMVREAFVISVVYVATGLEVEGVDEENMDSSIEKWLIELKYMTGKSMSSLWFTNYDTSTYSSLYMFI